MLLIATVTGGIHEDMKSAYVDIIWWFAWLVLWTAPTASISAALIYMAWLVDLGINKRSISTTYLALCRVQQAGRQSGHINRPRLLDKLKVIPGLVMTLTNLTAVRFHYHHLLSQSLVQPSPIFWCCSKNGAKTKIESKWNTTSMASTSTSTAEKYTYQPTLPYVKQFTMRKFWKQLHLYQCLRKCSKQRKKKWEKGWTWLSMVYPKWACNKQHSIPDLFIATAATTKTTEKALKDEVTRGRKRERPKQSSRNEIHSRIKKRINKYQRMNRWNVQCLLRLKGRTNEKCGTEANLKKWSAHKTQL